MKIKFLKEYKFLRGFENDVKFTTTQIFKDAIIDTVEDEVPDEDVQWLIDNGFAEEVKEGVKESGWWKPRLRERYYYLSPNGEVYSNQWENDSLDNGRLRLGSVFKTEEATERYRDYMEAIATVSQDDGFMRKNGGGFGWPVIECTTNNPGVDDIAGRQHAGEFYFDTREHALNSAMNHTREWQTILNYDWSKGEDEEDED